MDATPHTHTFPPPTHSTVTLANISFSHQHTPIAVLTNRHAYVYHQPLATWATLADDAFGMSIFATRRPPTALPHNPAHTTTTSATVAVTATGGALSTLQAAVTAGRVGPLLGGPSSLGAVAERQAVDSRGHLETNMAAAVALGSVEEYTQAVVAYVGHLTSMR